MSPVTSTRRPRLAATLSVTTAVSLSLSLHGSLPWLSRFVNDAPAIGSLELYVLAAPKLLPIDVEERQGPAAEAGGEGASASAAGEAPLEDDPTPATEAPPPPAEELRPAVVPKTPPAAPEIVPTVPPLEDSPHQRVTPPSPNQNDRAARLAALRRKVAERARKRGHGRGRHGAGREERGEGEGDGEAGGSARAAGEPGDPEAVYACSAEGLGKEVEVVFERPVHDWVTVVPTVLLPFRARPGMLEYLGAVSQVVSRRKGRVPRAGPVEFALPATPLEMDLEAPGGVRVVLGRPDGRCLVGLTYTKQLFPLTLSRVPVRVVDHAGRTATALAHVKLFKDASFELQVIDGALPFARGSLANAKAIAQNIETHYAAADVFKQVAGWFGVDVAKMARESREARAKKRPQSPSKAKAKASGSGGRSARAHR